MDIACEDRILRDFVSRSAPLVAIDDRLAGRVIWAGRCPNSPWVRLAMERGVGSVTQRLTRLKPCHVRHHDVENKQVGVKRFGHAQGSAARVASFDGKIAEVP